MSVERHEMPNGSVVFYRGSDHQYNAVEEMKRDLRVRGISTISKNDGDTSNDGLLDWAHREAKAGRYWRDSRGARGAEGTISHDVLQSLSEGATPLLRTGYDHGVRDWWEKRLPDAKLVEQVVYSEDRNIAGRFDLMADIQGQSVLLDLKTSKYAANAFAIQLNLYRVAAWDAGFPPPERLMVLQVFEDGSWHELPIPIRPDWALAALQTYEHGKEIGKHMRGARKQAEAVAA